MAQYSLEETHQEAALIRRTKRQDSIMAYNAAHTAFRRLVEALAEGRCEDPQRQARMLLEAWHEGE